MIQLVSEFSVNQQSSIQEVSQKPLSLTPNTIHTKCLLQTQTQSTINNYSNQQQHSPSSSSYKCQQCPQHLSSLTLIKKRQIKLQYQIEKLKQQMQHIKRQNTHLKQLQFSHHQKNIQKYNPIMYFKQDLQAELYQAKYLLQLHTLSTQYNSNNSNITQNNIKNPTLTIKQSTKQQQSLQKLSKPIDLKLKCQQLLLQNIKLQQKTMIKDKIIQQRVLFPLYHYDERILMLRKAVQYWYRRAEQETGKLAQVILEVKKYQKELKRQAKVMVLQEKAHWQGEIKKILNFIQIDNDSLRNNNSLNFISQSLKNTHNQTQQKQYNKVLLSKSYNQNNILIEQDHTIYSLCENIRDNSNSIVSATGNNTKGRQKCMSNKQRNSIKQKHQNILCESCMNSSVNECRKKSKNNNCSIVNNKENKKQQKSININNMVSGKNSAKNESKYDNGSVDRKSEDLSKRTIIKRKHTIDVNNNNNNSSMLGKNFQNIEIKMKTKDYNKCDINCSKKPKQQTKSPIIDFSCQRCAERIL